MFLALSTVGFLGMAEAAGISAGALRAFEIDASQASRVTDVFAKAATSSLFTVEGLGFAIGTAGAIANSFNISLEETVATLSLVRNAGILASRSGTGLRSFIAAIAGLTRQDINELRRAGIDVKEVQRQLNEGSLIGVARALEGIDPDVLIRVVGTEAANVAEIVSRSGEQIEQFTGTLRDSRGEAERMRQTINRGIVGAFREFYLCR